MSPLTRLLTIWSFFILAFSGMFVCEFLGPESPTTDVLIDSDIFFTAEPIRPHSVAVKCFFPGFGPKDTARILIRKGGSYAYTPIESHAVRYDITRDSIRISDTLRDTVPILFEKSFYYLSVFHIDAQGKWDYKFRPDSVITLDETSPENIRELKVIDRSASSLKIGWQQSLSRDVKNTVLYCDTVYRENIDTTHALFSIMLPADTTSYIVQSLKEKQYYAFFLLSMDSSGLYSPLDSARRISTWTTDTTPPLPVAELTVTVFSGSSVILSWQSSPSEDKDSVEVRYAMTRSDARERPTSTLWHYSTADINIDTITGLLQKRPYFFSVFTRDSSGNWSHADSGSQASIQIPDTICPDDLSDFRIIRLSKDSILISWAKKYSSDADSITLRYKRDQTDSAKIISELSVSTDSCWGFAIDHSDSSGYFFLATVCDSVKNCSNGTSAYFCLRTNIVDSTAPLDVKNVHCSYNIKGDSLVLQWSPSSSPQINSVIICYRTGGSCPASSNDPIRIALDNSLSNTSFYIPKPDRSSRYCFAIYVRSIDGRFSNGVSTTFDWMGNIIDTIPPTPATDLQLSLSNDLTIVLSWKSSVSDDADTALIRFSKNDRYPQNPYDQTLLQTHATTANTIFFDTLHNVDENSWYRFTIFSKDTANNWSTAIKDSINTPDRSAPVPLRNFKCKYDRQTDSLKLEWGPSQSPDADSAGFAWKTGGSCHDSFIPGFTGLVPQNETSTAFVVPHVDPNISLCVSAFVKDRSEHWSSPVHANISVVVDSITTVVIKTDTIREVLNDTIHDTIEIIRTDTLLITKTDTLTIVKYDTIQVSIYDTILVQVHDTTKITIHDTTIVNHIDTIFITAVDTIRPINVRNLTAAVLSDTLVLLLWTPSGSGDVKTTVISYRTDGSCCS
jgi:hypothetical protein